LVYPQPFCKKNPKKHKKMLKYKDETAEAKEKFGGFILSWFFS